MSSGARSEFVEKNQLFRSRPTFRRKFYLGAYCSSHSTAQASLEKTSREAEPETFEGSAKGTNSSSTSTSRPKPRSAGSSTKEFSTVDSILHELPKCSEHELAKTVKHVAGLQRENIKSDIQSLQKSNSEIDSLCEDDLTKWISERNAVVRGFLKGDFRQNYSLGYKD